MNFKFRDSDIIELQNKKEATLGDFRVEMRPKNQHLFFSGPHPTNLYANSLLIKKEISWISSKIGEKCVTY
jgi:hypothetical protein